MTLFPLLCDFPLRLPRLCLPPMFWKASHLIQIIWEGGQFKSIIVYLKLCWRKIPTSTVIWNIAMTVTIPTETFSLVERLFCLQRKYRGCQANFTTWYNPSSPYPKSWFLVLNTVFKLADSFCIANWWGRFLCTQMSILFPELRTPNVNSTVYPAAAAAAKSLQLCLTLWLHRRQPTRLLCPWDSPGKNTGVGCHFLLRMHFKQKSSAKEMGLYVKRYFLMKVSKWRVNCSSILQGKLLLYSQHQPQMCRWVFHTNQFSSSLQAPTEGPKV